MAIKAEFLAGQTEKRVSALYQWDYGQMLEIEAPNLPTIIEVHFACPAMTEAVVHTCSCVNGVAAVAIPDQCLEQEREITAWVYEVEGTSGRTLYRVFIPIIARTRPSRGESIPVEVQDTYTQLITEVNEAVGKIANGEIMVATAAKATSADRATQADNASSAANATSAGYATNAGTADKATHDKNGNEIGSTYQKRDRGGFMPKMHFVPVEGRLYQFRVLIGNTYFFAVSSFRANYENVVSVGPGYVNGTLYHLALAIKADKSVVVYGYQADNGTGSEWNTFEIMFREI